jgi:hypothetical protein
VEERAKSWNFSLQHFYEKAIQIDLKFGINQASTCVPAYGVRAKIFCCDRNRALLQSSIVIEKNK